MFKILLEFVGKYFWAYYVSRAYNMNRIADYSYVLNSYMLLKENKFDLAKESFKLVSNNYLDEFYDFTNNTLDYQSGLIWNGTIENKVLFFFDFFKF